jgi:sugar diacid utilization regulator
VLCEGLEGGSANRLILFAIAAGDANGANDLTAVLDWEAANEDGELAWIHVAYAEGFVAGQGGSIWRFVELMGCAFVAGGRKRLCNGDFHPRKPRTRDAVESDDLTTLVGDADCLLDTKFVSLAPSRLKNGEGVVEGDAKNLMHWLWLLLNAGSESSGKGECTKPLVDPSHRTGRECLRFPPRSVYNKQMGPSITVTAPDNEELESDPPKFEPLTLVRVLKERLLRRGVVLAGETALAVQIQWCRSIHDAIAVADRLDGILVIGDEGEATPETIVTLARRGAAGVLVRSWTAKRWEQWPPPEKFVVVGVPGQVAVDATIRLVARLSLAYESHVLRYAQTVHTALATLLHRGAGVNALTDLLEKLSDCAVAVVDPQLQLKAFAEGQRKWLDPTTIGAVCREILQPISVEIPEEGAVISHEPLVLRHEVKGHPVTCVIGAIEMADHAEGWIVLLYETDPPLAHDIAEHCVAVKQASNIIGTELMRVRSVERAEERARGNFVHALLHGRFSNSADLVARAVHHDFPVDGRFGVVVIQARGLIAEDDSPNRLANMAREASRIQPSGERRTMSAVVGDVIAVIRQVSPAGRSGPDQGARELAAFAAAAARSLQGQTDRTVQVSFGRPVTEAKNIGESFREARIALVLSAQLRLTAPSGFSDLRVHSTLLSLAQDGIGRSFTQEILGPLKGAPGKLEEAMRTYVEAGGNINKAARELAVHRNTMLYKLERASSVLGWDMRGAEAQFAVWLALKLDMLARTADLVGRDLDSGGI